jgi:phosphate:Na+ symporter
MNIYAVIIETLGGLGLFLLGMHMMTEGLQMTAGQRIRSILKTVSSNRFVGCITGAVVTAIIQSSSATSVMLIGFVSAGLMTLHQAVGMIIGANIGTTLTAQLIAFKLSSLALPAIALGVGLKFFATRKKYRYIGEVILGFGLLFFGMTVMKHALAPIKNEPTFIEFFTKFDPSTLSGLFLCVAVGAVLTVMVQSSSATIGLTMTLATQGLLDFPAAMALVLGENIGTTITAQLATIGSSNQDAHRVARAHAVFNIFGVLIMLIIFPYFVQFVKWISLFLGANPVNQVVDGEVVNISRYIANGHSIFNVTNAVIFLFIMPLLVKAAIFLSPKERHEDIFHMPEFDQTFRDSPVAATVQARSELYNLSQVVRMALNNAMDSWDKKDRKSLQKAKRYEQHINAVHKEIQAYLTSIFQSEINESLSIEISNLMRVSNNLERIGNSVENISHLLEDILEHNLPFSSQAQEDLKTLSEKVNEFLELVSENIQNESPQLLEDAQKLENTIDTMREEMRLGHIDRLKKNICKVDSGLIFIELLTRFEKIGDWSYNIAKALSYEQR